MDMEAGLFLPGALARHFYTPLIGQPTDQVWGQLTEQSAAAQNNGYKRLNYMIGYLDNAKEPLDNWPVHLAAGSSYLIVGVCDNDCTDVDLYEIARHDKTSH